MTKIYSHEKELSKKMMMVTVMLMLMKKMTLSWCWCTALDMAAQLTAVPRLTQPSTLHGMVKW